MIGAVCGILAGFVLRKDMDDTRTMVTLLVSILLTSCVGFFFNNQVMPSPVLNFMLIGMAFSAAFSNMMSEERLEQLMRVFNPVLGVPMILVILNLGAPFDYHLILGAESIRLFIFLFVLAGNTLVLILELQLRILQLRLRNI